METDRTETAQIFKAFCDPTRLAILEQLRSGEKCACVIQEQLSVGQSGLSYHMKVLTDSGIVSARQEGRWMHYSLSSQGQARAMAMLEALTTPELEAVAGCACA